MDDNLKSGSADGHIIGDRLSKLADIRAMGLNPYPYSFNKNDDAADILSKFSSLKPEQKSGVEVNIAGRILLLRREYTGLFQV